MNNYEYIIASLPLLGSDGRTRPDADALLSEIRSQLSSSDRNALDKLLTGFEPDNLDAEFYRSMLKERNRFLREFFLFDLCLRNSKTEYLNKALGRAEGTDCIRLPELEEYDFPAEEAAGNVLSGSDIIQRERGLDDLLWAEIDRIDEMEVFSLNLILGFVAKLKIVDRWNRLDPESGSQLFRKLVTQIRSTYDNKKQNIL